MSFGRSGTDAILEIIYHNLNPHITDEQGKELSVELFGGGWRKMKEVKHPRSLMIRYYSEVTIYIYIYIYICIYLYLYIALSLIAKIKKDEE